MRFGRGQPLTYPLACVWRHKWIAIPTAQVPLADVKAVVGVLEGALRTWSLDLINSDVELVQVVAPRAVELGNQCDLSSVGAMPSPARNVKRSRNDMNLQRLLPC